MLALDHEFDHPAKLRKARPILLDHLDLSHRLQVRRKWKGLA